METVTYSGHECHSLENGEWRLLVTRSGLAYWWNAMPYVKHAEYDDQAQYYDFGSSSECYCNDKFLELETLAPVGTIPPEGTVTHVETWDFYRDINRPYHEDEVQLLVEKLRVE